MDAKAISAALGGKRYGNSYRAPCPVCGGSDKSTKFVLRDASDRILVYCHAGCTFADIVAELRRRGLWPDATPGQRQKWTQRRNEKDAEEGKTWLMIAESAVERGEVLSKRERQRHYLLRRLYGGEYE